MDDWRILDCRRLRILCHNKASPKNVLILF
jgi:hypothetical protein